MSDYITFINEGIFLFFFFYDSLFSEKSHPPQNSHPFAPPTAFCHAAPFYGGNGSSEKGFLPLSGSSSSSVIQLFQVFLSVYAGIWQKLTAMHWGKIPFKLDGLRCLGKEVPSLQGRASWLVILKGPSWDVRPIVHIMLCVNWGPVRSSPVKQR